MAKLSDADLLGGDDDDLKDEKVDDGLDALDGGSQDRDEVLGGSSVDPSLKPEDDLEVVVLDEDEGAGRKAAVEADETHAETAYDDDAGEVVDPLTLITAEERKNWPEALQKRVGRERRLKAEERARADAAEAARQRAEAALLESQRVNVSLVTAMLAGEIEKKQRELKAAKEAGETDTEIKVQGELEKLRADARDAERAKEALAKAPEPKETKPTNPIADRWLGRNRWMQHQDFRQQAAATRGIDIGLAAEVKAGEHSFAVGSVEYFNELDRRVATQMPGLKSRVQRVFGGGGAKTTVAPVTRGAVGRPAAKKNQVQLTRADLENMRDFGMDPNNKEHLQEYAMNKRNRERGVNA
ncbi:MAG: hypothetical protein IT514_15435 [Burkholderiales bacterium]|nr:hypothetical protein [Burkholderiales bacterium]